MIRFKALNEEESSGSETDDDSARKKQTRESLEEGAASLYNQALTLLIEGKNEEATEILEGLLDSAYLHDDEEKTPMQIQVRRGCLKNLSIIYSSDPDQLESAQRVLMEAVDLDPRNVTLWTRLGNVNYKLQNFSEAYFDYLQGLKCSPHHWICIEKLVTLAYILGDYVSCLHYCAYGLERDCSFVRGAVFRDAILEASPIMNEVGKSVLDNWEHLVTKTPYDSKWKSKYLGEAEASIASRRSDLDACRKVAEDKQEKVVIPVKKVNSMSLVELCQLILSVHDHLVQSESQSLTCAVEIVYGAPEPNGKIAEEDSDVEGNRKNENVDETSTSSFLRGRSGSDEKENDKSTGGQNNGPSDFATFEECSQSQQSQDASQEPEARKKSRKDVKWWQYEGKRRSQRVRGHLMPVSQNATKSERGFAESLKNLIHPSLSCTEPEKNNEVNKQQPEADADKYFGSQAETEDVKKFIASCGKKNFLTVMTEMAPRLCELSSNKSWPAELVELYIECCKKYRLYRQEQNEWLPEGDGDINLLKQDALIALSVVELRLDSSTPGNIEQLKYDSSFVSDLSYLEIVSRNSLVNDSEFQVRYCWFKVNYELALAQVGLAMYTSGLRYLRLLENLLSEKPDLVMNIPTKSDNVISMEEVKKKIRFVKKMENISRISELHQNQKYGDLIEILQLCLTSDDSTSTDLMNRLYLAEAYFNVHKYIECLEQCVKTVGPALKNRNDQVLGGSLQLIEKICEMQSEKLVEVPMKEKRTITNAMIEILTWNENKNSVPEAILIPPWCILHNILFSLEVSEPALYLDEESTPNSVVLLQFAHEFLNRSNKCTVCDGKLLLYTIEALHPVRYSDEYGPYEETKTCIEQAVFCLYSHPSKKAKVKYLSDHNTTGVELQWSKCLQLYEYYKPERIPEFDSYETLSSDVEALFQRILAAMPEDVKPTSDDFAEMNKVLEGRLPEISAKNTSKFPPEFIDIYYLLGDHYFKTKEWTKSVEYYLYDLIVYPVRFDSWAAIALAKAEMISSKLNACEDYNVEDVIFSADIVINCFRRSLELEPNNHKIRIEFGSFVYAMFSFCSRILKQNDPKTCSEETKRLLEVKKESFLKAAHKCFEPMAKSSGITECEDDEIQNELWIHHYMLGKILEKLNKDDPEKFLAQYELAGKLIHEQGGMYPAKINYFKPPDLAVEALEIYYRIHASILSYIQRHDYDEDKENILLTYVERAAKGPFMKAKQSRGEKGEEGRRKASEDAKKGQVEIKSLMEEILKKVEQMVERESSSSSSNTSDNEDDDGTSVTSSQASTLYTSEDELAPSATELPPINTPVMSSFGLSAFQEKMREKEIQESKNIMKASQVSQEGYKAVSGEENNIRIEKNVDRKNVTRIPSKELFASISENKFYKDFAGAKYGRLVCLCLTAMEECISRFPQHHKSYFRIAYTYSTMAQDKWKVAKEYLMGNPAADKKKICGLFADRKTSNFFNGVWRNPVDDVDRPGSFPYHMSKTVAHLLEILLKLNDHQLLAEVGIALSKVPEHDKQYLFNSDRLNYSQQAFSDCLTAAKKFWVASSTDVRDAAVSLFETYQKLQKFSAKENVLSGVLVECYKQYMEQFGQDLSSMCNLEQAFKFFQHLTWASKTSGASGKVGKNVGITPQSAPTNPEILSMFRAGQANPSAVTSKGGEGRKKKDVSARLERQTSKEHLQLPTASLSLSKIEESLREGDTRVPKKKKMISTDGQSSRTMPIRPQKHAEQEAGKFGKDLLTANIMARLWKDTGTNPEFLKPLISDRVIPTGEPEIIDLSGNLSGNLKRKGEVEKDPLTLTPPPKKSAIVGDSSANVSRAKNAKDDHTQATFNKAAMPALPKLTPMPSTGGIPFDVFMNCVNKGGGDFAHRASSIMDQAKQAASYSTVPSQSKAYSHLHISSTVLQQGNSSKSVSAKSSQPIPQKKNVQPQPQPSQRDDRTQKASQSSNAKITSTSFSGQKKGVPVSVSSFLSSRNTSPFRAQSTVLLNPTADAPRHSLSARSTVDTTGAPPPAHSSRNRTPSERSSGDEPEIIDLTTPPRKSESIVNRPSDNLLESITIGGSSRKKQDEMYFVPKATSSISYPMPPKKSFQARKRDVSSESSEDMEVITVE